jgi:alpha-aminoadipate/glutamate carrier protein LysW
MNDQSQCPICDAAIAMPAGTVPAEIIPCPECGSDLEVLACAPFALAPAPSVEEDWGQ